MYIIFLVERFKLGEKNYIDFTYVTRIKVHKSCKIRRIISSVVKIHKKNNNNKHAPL